MSFDHYEPIKKFSSHECLEALIKAVKDDPTLVRNHIKLYTAEQVNEFSLTLWPAVLDETAWDRISTRRPKKIDESNNAAGNVASFLGGSDSEVRTFENTVWMDDGKTLEGIVTTQLGEIISVEVRVIW
jgi:hypothetical protein